MTRIFDCSDEQQRDEGIAAAVEELAAGHLVVLPTDTVYGLAADAFSPIGVEAIFSAKGRGRDMPPPVLVPSPRTVDGLAMALPSYAKRLVKEFWPGGLTIVVRAQQSLAWDLGDTNGTVGLRMPDDDVTLRLLADTGPLAVSSANRTGKPSAKTVTEAGFMLGPYVEVYLDDGERASGTASTIIDCTKPDPVILRVGAVSIERIRAVLGDGVELVLPPAEQDPQGDEGAPLWSGDEADSADADPVGDDDGSLGKHWQDSESGAEPDEPDAQAQDNPNWSYGEDAPHEAQTPTPHYPQDEAQAGPDRAPDPNER